MPMDWQRDDHVVSDRATYGCFRPLADAARYLEIHRPDVYRRSGGSP